MKRYIAQFMGHNSTDFSDIADWATEKQARGHVLMTVNSNPRIKAGRVYDSVEEQVVGDVYYGEEDKK
ncbi:MAG: hypothetical protein R3264_09280 [Anaerolineae bacterium]|nr:hypothetical protein [Anaerolineae bacterium]